MEGGVVAFPTETYFGLGADIQNETAIEKLFTLKKRSLDKPILVLIDHIAQLDGLTSSIPEAYHSLIKHFWPGPLTLIFPASSSVSPLLTGNTSTIGVRISSNPLTRYFCRSWGKPLTATSANLSGTIPASNKDQVDSHFGNRIDYVFVSQGEESDGNGSTIVTLGENDITVLREGVIDELMIRKVMS